VSVQATLSGRPPGPTHTSIAQGRVERTTPPNRVIPRRPYWNGTVIWTTMGDYDTPCYRPQQDVLIPARSCLSPQLLEAFGDMAHVKPVAERHHLVAWAGSVMGTGLYTRARLTCGRDGAGSEELQPGYGPQSLWGYRDYLPTLNDTRFCPLPRGTTGMTFFMDTCNPFYLLTDYTLG
jgi:hypothetical protein